MSAESMLPLLGTLAAIAGLLFVGGLLQRRWASWRRGVALARQQRRAKLGEQAGEALLVAAGYTVLERQPVVRWTVLADGQPVSVALRPDLLVARGRRRFVAEVKTGNRAPRLQSQATLRQLLAYRSAFAVDGVLLIDMEARALHEVAFPAAGGAAARSRWPALLIALLLGALIGGGVVAWWLGALFPSP